MIKEDGTVVFEGAEQQELDRIINDRLGREKQKYHDYEDAKGILEELNAYGYQGDAKAVRQAVKAQREETQRQQELQELQEQAKNKGTSPELLAEMRELKKELAEIKKEKEDKIQAVKQADQQKEKMATMVSEFEETYPDVDLEKLNNNDDFIEFYKDSNPNLSLAKVYERYAKYTHGAVQKATAKIQVNLDRSTSSGKNKQKTESYGLTERQKALAAENGMSEQQYAEKLKLIKR
jgi:uncharacterized protein (UPF0335 family)